MNSEQQQNQVVEQKVSDKELNFRALEAKYQKQLELERAARLEAERLAQEAMNKKNISSEDDEDDTDYVDKRRLKKEQAKFGQEIKQQTQQEINQAVHHALKEERKQNWIKQNPDFFDVLQHAEKFAQQDPELAETILEMPDTFERQKLVYKNIKALGLHKPPQKEPSIQEKIDANRRSPYYQPSGVSSAPYSNGGDFSPGGQKAAYEKMQQLKKQLRI